MPHQSQNLFSLKNIGLLAFFAAVFAYAWHQVMYGLTSVYIASTDLSARATGFYLAWLDIPHSANLPELLAKLRKFFEFCMVGEGFSHGVLNIFVRNIFSMLVYKVSLTPKVYYVLHFIPMCLLVIYAFLIGRQFERTRLAYVFTLAIIMAPLITQATRYSSFYTLLMPLAHAMVAYHWLIFIQNPDRPFNRLMASLSLAVYLTAGMDWVVFCPLLLFYLILNKKLTTSLRNGYNIIPFMVFFTQAMFCLRLYLVNDRMYGLDRWKTLYVSYPLFKFMSHLGVDGGSHKRTSLNIDTAIGSMKDAFSLACFLAIAAALFIVLYRIFKAVREKGINLDAQQSFVFVMASWLLAVFYPLAKTADASQYYTVVAFPTLFLASYLVAQNTRFRILDGVMIAIFVGFMAKVPDLSDTRMVSAFDNDQRAMAVAGYIIEKRPDLLTKDKTTLLPYVNDEPNNVEHLGQYLVGTFSRKRPEFWLSFRNGMPEGFDVEIQAKGGLLADGILPYVNWLVVSSDMVFRLRQGSSLQNSDYYKAFLTDPKIDWIAQFKDEKARTFWLGEVRLDNIGKNRTAKQAPQQSIDEFFSLYNNKYNKVSYLKHGLDYWVPMW